MESSQSNVALTEGQVADRLGISAAAGRRSSQHEG